MQLYSLLNVLKSALHGNTGWWPALRTPTLQRSYKDRERGSFVVKTRT